MMSHYVVVDRYYRVLWHGSAIDPNQAVRAAKACPIDWPDNDEVKVIGVHSGPKIGPKAIRSALAHGVFVGIYKGNEYVRRSAAASSRSRIQQQQDSLLRRDRQAAGEAADTGR